MVPRNAILTVRRIVASSGARFGAGLAAQACENRHNRAVFEQRSRSLAPCRSATAGISLMNPLVLPDSEGPDLSETSRGSRNEDRASHPDAPPLCAVRSSPLILFAAFARRRFGIGFGVLGVANPQCRAGLFHWNAFAIALLTLFDAACERVGMDRRLEVDDPKRRTRSLSRQGGMRHELTDSKPNVRLRPAVERFGEGVNQRAARNQAFSYG